MTFRLNYHILIMRIGNYRLISRFPGHGFIPCPFFSTLHFTHNISIFLSVSCTMKSKSFHLVDCFWRNIFCRITTIYLLCVKRSVFGRFLFSTTPLASYHTKQSLLHDTKKEIQRTVSLFLLLVFFLRTRRVYDTVTNVHQMVANTL